ncbi:MAG: class I SAM-dependent methyltransferase, partial [Deltaproteobacteria bacterium]|nr:class I SAM-dependent methyltransferase [Deltaproteobacteria bacterium]
TVVATDVSSEALTKARRLADEHGARVDFRLVDVHDWAWPSAEYDAVVGVFIQFSPPSQRALVFDAIKRAVRPGGLVLLHGYTPEQVELGTGGPSEPDFMYTPQLLERAFVGWSCVKLRTYEKELQEGNRHVGRSALIDFVARRPAE